MKKIFCIALTLFASVVAFTQEKTIEQVEFDKVYKNSFRWTANQPRRETRTEETVFEVFPPTNSTGLPAVTPSPRKTYIKSITEFQSGKSHSIFESNSESLSLRRETIMNRGKIYTKEENGNWREEVFAAKPKPEATTRTKDVEVEYKYLGDEIMNNQKASIYAKIETGKLVSLKNNQKSLLTNTTKYWFGEDGKLMMTESVRKIQSDRTMITSQSATKYETDPNIKIEAPK